MGSNPIRGVMKAIVEFVNLDNGKVKDQVNHLPILHIRFRIEGKIHALVLDPKDCEFAKELKVGDTLEIRKL